MRVPIYERQAELAPLQGGDVTPLMPAGDYGANAAGVAKNFLARLQQMQNDTEDARTLELFNKFKNDSLEYHENPDKGIYNTRLGYQSQGIYSEADKWLRERGEHYVRDLKSERAKTNFRRMARDYITQLGTQNSRFEADQMKKYQAEQADADIKNWLNEVEKNWNDPEAIKRAREGIQQALELKMRGSGKEAFTDAWNEIENQIGLARIRQAYVKDPLLAVRMIDDPDIKLNPKTRAELINSLRGKTEIYELNAIAQTYSRYYSPENSTQAYNDLINRYGADKGQKAFNALSHIWSIANSQENAREQALRKLQQENELTLYKAFNDPNVENPTEEQINSFFKSKTISQHGHSVFINHIKSLQAEEQRAKEAQEKLQREKNNIQLKLDAINGNFPSDKILEYGVKNGDFSFEAAEYVRNRRNKSIADAEKEKQSQEKKRLSDNANNYLIRINNGDYPTREEILNAQKNNDLTPQDVSSFLKIIDAHENNDIKTEQEETERAIEIMLNSGGSISREEVNQLVENKKISDTGARRFWNWVDTDEAKIARAEAKRQKEQATQAEQEKLAELDNLAKQIVDGAENKSYVLNYIEGLNLSVENKDLLRTRAEKHWNAKEQTQKDNQAISKEQHDIFFSDMMLSAKKGTFKTPDEMLELLSSKNITRQEYEDYERERKIFLETQEKADKELWKDRMRDIAEDLARKYPLDHQLGVFDEINAMSENDRAEVRKHYDRLIGEQRIIKNNEEKAKAEQQKQNYKNLNDTYWRNFQRVPNNELEQLAKNGGLSDTLLERAYAMNEALSNRDKVETQLRRDTSIDFDSLSRGEQEAMIMQRMGTSQEQRAKNYARLFKMLLAGTLTDARIEWEHKHGFISTDDKENLKEYEKKFVAAQKRKLNQVANELVSGIRGVLQNRSDRTLYENNALNDFYRNTSNIDLLHTHNFNEVVDSIANAIKENTIKAIAEKYPLESGLIWKGLTGMGRRVEAWRNSKFTLPEDNPQLYYETPEGQQELISPEGVTQEFSNVVPLPEPPATPEPPAPVEYGNFFQDINNPYIQRITSPDAYRNSMPKNSQQTLQRIAPYEDIINTSADVNGIEPELIKAVIHAESRGNPNAVSSAGAQGLMQLMPDTAKELGVENSFDVTQNINGGAKYLAQLARRYNGDLRKILWAYNAGPANADKGKMPRPKQTNPYIKKVMDFYNMLKGKNANNSSIDIAPQPLVPPVVSTDEEAFADMASILFGYISGDISTSIDLGGF